MRTKTKPPGNRWAGQDPSRRGFTLLEVVVAMSLIVAMLGVVTPMVVRSMRLWKDVQRYQLVTDELSLQLDRLIRLGASERSDALSRLTISETIAGQFPGAKLSGQTVTENDEERLILAFNWKRPGAPPPIRLIGWIKSAADDRSTNRDAGGDTGEAIFPDEESASQTEDAS